MRILHFTSAFFPSLGGAQVAIHHLAEGLVSLGGEVLVCSPRSRGVLPERRYTVRQFRIIGPLADLGLRQAMYTGALRRIVRDWHPDVVHAHMAVPAGYAAVTGRRHAAAPVVLTCHGEDIQVQPNIGRGCRLHAAAEQRVSFTLQRADRCIAVSSDVRKEYLALGTPPERIAVIPNGILVSDLTAPDPAARAVLGLPKDRPIILAAGRNVPVKGFPFLLRAVQAARTRIPDILCVIVGARVPELHPLVRELGLEDAVRLFDAHPPPGIQFASRQARPPCSLATFFKAADVYAMSSIVESMGIVTAEAMAAGLPVVGVAGGGTADLVRDGVSGSLVPPDHPGRFGEAICEVIRSPDRRRAMGEAGRAAAGRFDRERVAAEHVALYRECLESRSRA